MAAALRNLVRGALLTAALAGLALAAHAQPTPVQPAPAPPDTVLPPPRSDERLPPPPSPSIAPVPAPTPAPFAPRPATPFAPRDAQDGIYFPRDPGQNGWGLYDWPSMPQQFFADAEVDILKPHLKSVLTGTATFPDGTQTTIQPPTTQVGWTAAPRLEVGWFIPPSLGFLALSYRGFASDGRQDTTALDGTPFALRSRLDLNQVTFDYGTTPYSYAPRWFISGRFGMALADVFFDNQAVSAYQTQYASNNYFGAGPHARADLWREFNLLPGLSLFGQADLTVLVGHIHQRYREDDTILGTTRTAEFTQRKTQTVPALTLRTGLSYVPSRLNNWRFMVGYEFEEWWFLGQIDGLDTRGQFNTNGVFLRAFFAF